MLKYYNKIHSRRSWNVLCLVWYLSDINRKIRLSNKGKKSLNIYANIPPYIFHFEYLFMFTYHISRSQCKSGMNARRAFIHLRIQENCPNYTIFLTTVNSNLSDVTKDVSVCVVGYCPMCSMLLGPRSLSVQWSSLMTQVVMLAH